VPDDRVRLLPGSEEVRDASHRLRQSVRKLDKFFRHVSILQEQDLTDVGASTFADWLGLNLEAWAGLGRGK